MIVGIFLTTIVSSDQLPDQEEYSISDPDQEEYSIADPDQEEYVVWIRIRKNTVLRIRNTVPYNERLRSLTGMKVLGCQI